MAPTLVRKQNQKELARKRCADAHTCFLFNVQLPGIKLEQKGGRITINSASGSITARDGTTTVSVLSGGKRVQGQKAHSRTRLPGWTIVDREFLAHCDKADYQKESKKDGVGTASDHYRFHFREAFSSDRNKVCGQTELARIVSSPSRVCSRVC
jgi:hypothetical protein